MARPPPGSNLAVQHNVFVGRVAELGRLTDALAGGARLVTIVGSGGVGKTRLARELGRRCNLEPVWFCDLSGVDAVAGLLRAIATPMDLTLEAEGDAAVRHAGHAVAGRGAALLILDNCEQIVEPSAALVICWLEIAPEVRFVVTSRERLRLSDETVLELTGLPSADAMALFEQRARRARSSFELAPSDRAPLEALMNRLDNNPLAVELAAARVTVLSVQQLAERVTESFSVLRSVRQDIPQRQRSLEAVIDWSWQLLSGQERDALVRCSVFHGGFALDAAEAVLDASVPIIDQLGALLDKSLIYSDAAANQTAMRFGMAETIREFAAARLAENRSDAERRHGDYYLGQAETWAAQVASPRRREALRHLSAEVDNLLAIAQRHGEPTAAARVALALDPMLREFGPPDVHLDLLDTACRDVDALPPPLAMKLLVARADAQRVRGRHDAARSDLERARDPARRTREAALEAQLLACDARLTQARGRLAEAQQIFAAALALSETCGDDRLSGSIQGDVGQLLYLRGHLDEAAVQYERSLDRQRALGDPRAIATLTGRLGIIDHWRCHLDKARAQLERAIDLLHEAGDATEGRWLAALGRHLHDRGELDEARSCLTRALSLNRRVGNLTHEGLTLLYIAMLEHEEGGHREALPAYERARNVLRLAGSRVREAMLMCWLGMLQTENGWLDDARASFEVAIEMHRATGYQSGVGYGLAHLGAVAALSGELDAAAASFEEADRLLAVSEKPEILARVGVLRGVLGVAHAREHGETTAAHGHLAKARAALDAAREGRAHGWHRPGPSTASSSGVRLLAHFLEPLLIETEAQVHALSGETTDLEVASDAIWFRVAGGERVYLARRKALRSILAALVELHHTERGRALDSDALFCHGWPGQNIGQASATNRLYVAIATLRKLGLRQLLLRRDDGYLIDPAAVIRRADRS